MLILNTNITEKCGKGRRFSLWSDVDFHFVFWSVIVYKKNTAIVMLQDLDWNIWFKQTVHMLFDSFFPPVFPEVFEID